MRYWAVDYIGDTDCELIVNDQLYATEEEAERARAAMAAEDEGDYEVNWYTDPDLRSIFDGNYTIDDNLILHY